MKHRIFLAINLPENIKKVLKNYQEQWPELPIRWTKKDNLHITLEFLGYISDDEILGVCKIADEIASQHKPFSINLMNICYGPPQKPPRMIWAVGEKSEEFASLKNDLENALTESNEIHFSAEERVFSPHITLGRINAWEFRKIEREEIPDISEEVSLNFEVRSIDVMESVLKKSGPSYEILKSCQLKN